MVDINRLVAVTFVVMILGVGLFPSSTAAQQGGDSLEMEMTVTEEGEVESVRMLWEMDGQTYDALNSSAADAGYETVAAWFAEEEMIPGDNGYEEYGEAKDTELEDGNAIEVTFTEFDMAQFNETEITAENDQVSVQMGNIDDPQEDDSFAEITYIVNMPGEITDSNAQEVDGNVATWHLHQNAPNIISVESELGSSDGGSSDDSDSVPGFGIVAAAVGLLIAVGTLSHRRD